MALVVGVPLIAPATAGAATQSASPTIRLDSSEAPDLKDWLENKVKPKLLEWYPKIQSTLGGTEPSSFSVTISSSYNGVASTAGTSIRLSAKYFREHQSDIGAVVHETVHVAQKAPNNVARWAIEGEADWFRYYRYEPTKLPKPPAGSTWKDGYRKTAYFFQYIGTRYPNANFPRKLHSAIQSGTPSADDVIKQATGKSTEQAWNEMMRADAI